MRASAAEPPLTEPLTEARTVRRDGALPAGETPAVQNTTQVDRRRLGGWDGGVSPPSCSRPSTIAATAFDRGPATGKDRGSVTSSKNPPSS
jgi:hypothetical protein